MPRSPCSPSFLSRARNASSVSGLKAVAASSFLAKSATMRLIASWSSVSCIRLPFLCDLDRGNGRELWIDLYRHDGGRHGGSKLGEAGKHACQRSAFHLQRIQDGVRLLRPNRWNAELSERIQHGATRPRVRVEDHRLVVDSVQRLAQVRQALNEAVRTNHAAYTCHDVE